MKLQSHYNRASVIGAICVLFIATIGYYFLLNNVLMEQVDDALAVEEAEIYDYIKKHDSLPDESVYEDQQLFFVKKTGPSFRAFNSLKIYNPEEKETESHRQLVFTLTVHNEQYVATIRKSTESGQDLLWLILFSTLPMVMLLMIIVYFIKRHLERKLWRPFYVTLSAIKKFNLSAPQNITTQPTRITEFRQLNESVLSMTDKVRKDYQSLKRFTDNASHEIQTPLAVIHSKLDILIQQPELKEDSMELIERIYSSVEKLSGITQKLLLLTKIEQQQFSKKEAISISSIVNEKITEMQDWINSAQLNVLIHGTDGHVQMDKDLAAILVSNLLRNAIQHSSPGTDITIETDAEHLEITNSGLESLDSSSVFDRFFKGGDSSGNGLGLSIVAQICEQYGFHYDYEFRQNKHIFSVWYA